MLASTWLFPLAMILAASPLLAQPKTVPQISFGGGYLFLHDFLHWPDATYPGGFWLFGDVELGRSVAIAGEYSQSFKSHPVFRGTSPRIELDAVTLGPEVRFRRESRWSPFVHVLAGVYRVRTKSFYGSWSGTDFMVQPGGGIDIRLHERVSLRGQVDLRTIFDDGEAIYQLRVATGVAVHLGLEEPPEEPVKLPRLELGGGFAVADDDQFDGGLPGWWISAGVGLHPHLSIAGEYSRVTAGYEQWVSAWMIGLQVPFALGTGRVMTFGRFFVGQAERQYFGGDYTDKTGGFAIQPGGGVDVSLKPPLAARFAVDYRIMFEEFYGNSHLLRFTAGLVVR